MEWERRKSEEGSEGRGSVNAMQVGLTHLVHFGEPNPSKIVGGVQLDYAIQVFRCVLVLSFQQIQNTDSQQHLSRSNGMHHITTDEDHAPYSFANEQKQTHV